MKFHILTFVLIICIQTQAIYGHIHQNVHGNRLSSFGPQRKPLASYLANGLHDNDYKRAKRQSSLPPNQALEDLQNDLVKAKNACAREQGMNSNISTKSLMYAENPTHKEKCLIACILKKNNLMDSANRLSVNKIKSIAGAISDENPLIIAVAEAKAQQCNSMIRSHNTCDAAYQINKYIAAEMRALKLKLFY